MPPDSPTPAHNSGCQVISSRTAYQNRWMAVREDHIIRPDGSPGIYGVVEKPDGMLKQRRLA